MKKAFTALLVGLVLILVATACSGGPGNATVHLTDQNFAQSSVTVGVGHTLTLVDDTAAAHNITNGSWVDGNAQPNREPGAPTVSVPFVGHDTHVIGPFNTTGTFHIMCTIHPGMNLTIIVQ
jgi:plastocyanin